MQRNKQLVLEEKLRRSAITGAEGAGSVVGERTDLAAMELLEARAEVRVDGEKIRCGLHLVWQVAITSLFISAFSLLQLIAGTISDYDDLFSYKCTPKMGSRCGWDYTVTWPISQLTSP